MVWINSEQINQDTIWNMDCDLFEKVSLLLPDWQSEIDFLYLSLTVSSQAENKYGQLLLARTIGSLTVMHTPPYTIYSLVTSYEVVDDNKDVGLYGSFT